MNPITHLLVGWTAGAACQLERRDRCLVALAGVVPDVDGFGVVVDVLTAASASPTDAVSAAVLALGQRRGRAALLAFASFHLHLIGDLVGARGPDGEQWPFSYLAPFSDGWIWQWSGQWALNAWPNTTLTALLLAVALYAAWRHGCSPLEILSTRAERAVVTALRRRFGLPRSPLEGTR